MENFKVGSKDFTKKVQCFKKYKDEVIESICNAAATVEDMHDALDLFLCNGIIEGTMDSYSEIYDDLPQCVITYLENYRNEVGVGNIYYFPELIESVADSITIAAGQPWSALEYKKYEDALTKEIFEFIKKYKVIGIII